MADEKNKSTTATKVTGETASREIHDAKVKEKAVQDAVEKGKKIVEEFGKIVRKQHGPPGTP